MKKWMIISALALAVVFCNIGAPTPDSATSTPDVGAMINATLTAIAAETEAAAPLVPSPTFTPVPPAAGVISGSLSYPSERIPPLRIVAFTVGSDVYQYILTLENQSTYTFELPAGTYNIVAYLVDGSYAGGYSQAVPCGLAAECADHSLINVVVEGGATVSGIDPGDWYAPEGSFPPMPAP